MVIGCGIIHPVVPGILNIELIFPGNSECRVFSAGMKIVVANKS
jgi:hypothetical protein